MLCLRRALERIRLSVGGLLRFEPRFPSCLAEKLLRAFTFASHLETLICERSEGHTFRIRSGASPKPPSAVCDRDILIARAPAERDQQQFKFGMGQQIKILYHRIRNARPSRRDPSILGLIRMHEASVKPGDRQRNGPLVPELAGGCL